MKKIIGMGNALVDVLVTIPDDNILLELGLLKGSMRLVDFSFSERVLNYVNQHQKSILSGGSASNTIHGLSRLGAECAFIGKVSDDEFGKIFKTDMINNSITPVLFTEESSTGRAVALISPDSERTFATHLGCAVKLSATEISVDLFHDYHYFHIEGYLVQDHDLIEKALSTAKGKGLVTSLDLASFNIVGENLEFLNSVIKKYVDIVFANEEEALAFTGLPPEESVKKISEICRIAVVKTGARGSLVSNGKNIYHIDPFKVNPVDTTGAGDLYAAGFLFGLMNDMPIEKAAKIGSFLAAKVIERIGAKIPVSEWEKIKEEIKNI